MSKLCFTLLGRFQVKDGDTSLPGLEARKVQELLGYLLLHRRRTHTREVLTEMLWADQPPAQSRKYLRQALWQIQSVLDAHRTDQEPPALLVDAEWLRANPDACCWVDVAEFERAHVEARGVPGWRLDARLAEVLAIAVQLYQGHLLEDCYEDWCLFERERLHLILLEMLDKLTECCEAHGQYEAGLAYGERTLSYDYAQERAHRRLMRLHYLAGDRTAALRQYERCVAALDQELGVGPARSTVDLCERIRADRPVDELSPSSPHQASDPGHDAISELLYSLRRLHADLNALQRDIGAVEQTLARE